MDKLIVMNLGKGDLETGFPNVTLRVCEDGKSMKREKQRQTWLPGKPELIANYQNWNDDCFSANASATISWKKSFKRLNASLNDWLKSEPFRSKWDTLLNRCTSENRIRVIIETDDLEAQKLPWYLWNFFEKYPLAEPAISIPEYEDNTPVVFQKNVRILTIIGDINQLVEYPKEIQEIEQLKNVDNPQFLWQPSPSEISSKLWEESWNILFFSGHSETVDGEGRFYLKPKEYLTVGELKDGCKNAVTKGLKLAIFNSCNGLGIARDLAEAHIPQAIVMRSYIPDPVAQKFLKFFLNAYSHGQTLYLSVREARKRLKEELGTQFPGADCLPVIFQNPAVLPPTWEELSGISSAANPTVNSALPSESGDLVHNCLLRLNYRDQVTFFKRDIPKKISAYLIHGDEDCGQKWLLNRLIKLINLQDNSRIDKAITVKMSRKTRATYIQALWRELAGRVGLSSQSSQVEIIGKFSKLCQTQNVVLIFDRVETMPRGYLNKFIGDFWQPLVEKVSASPPNSQNYRLLMFLIDSKGSLQESEFNFAEQPDSNWQPHIPIKLPRIAKIVEKDLESWIDNAVNELPTKLTIQREEIVRNILENSEDGLPQLVLERICELWQNENYWNEKESIWLRY